MKQIVVVGAGKIGSTIADMLAETGDSQVTVVDRSQAALDSLETGNAVETLKVEISEAGALDAVLAGKFAVLSAAPFHLTTRIAEAAAKAGVHYLDLTEDVASTRIVKELATTAKSAFIPQCGLAPGFISIVANDLAADDLARRTEPCLAIQRHRRFVFRYDAQGDMAATGQFRHQLQHLHQRLAAIAEPLVALVDHQPVDPVIAVVRVERVHGETDRPVIGIDGEGHAMVAVIGLLDRIFIAGDKILLRRSNLQFKHFCPLGIVERA